MKKKLLIVLLVIVVVFLVFHETKTHDLKNASNLVIEKLKEKKPESRTQAMVTYLKNKASKDADLSDENTLTAALSYIKNNIENANSISKMENLIYYGYILQYSPKKSNMGTCTTIGIKTVEAVSEVYVKDNKYKKNKKEINKTKMQIIKALISREDKA